MPATSENCQCTQEYDHLIYIVHFKKCCEMVDKQIEEIYELWILENQSIVTQINRLIAEVSYNYYYYY